MKSFEISRRTFVRKCAVATAATGLPLWFIERDLLAATHRPKPLAPNDRPGIALIGCGGMGRGDAANASRLGELLAVCDVDANHLAVAAKQFTKDGKAPAQYADFRKVMERDDIHIILTCTPDHWHTLVNLAAINAGKDIYGEKPLTLTIDEGKHVARAVQEAKCVLQTGSQQRSDPKFRLACELVRNGRLGKMKEVTVWLPAGLREGPFSPKPVPPELDWDFWLGQAPKVDYLQQRCHLFFRYWYDYSGGTMTDWGAHHNDIVLWALGLPGPTEVEGKAQAQPIAGGYTAIAEYEVKFTYANGVIHHVRSTKADNIYGAAEEPDGQRNGIRFEGSAGWIWVNRGNLRASDKALLEQPLPDDAQRLYKSNDHMANFFDCVRSRKAPIADVQAGHRGDQFVTWGQLRCARVRNFNGTSTPRLFTVTTRRRRTLSSCEKCGSHTTTTLPGPDRPPERVRSSNSLRRRLLPVLLAVLNHLMLRFARHFFVVTEGLPVHASPARE